MPEFSKISRGHLAIQCRNNFKSFSLKQFNQKFHIEICILSQQDFYLVLPWTSVSDLGLEEGNSIPFHSGCIPHDDVFGSLRLMGSLNFGRNADCRKIDPFPSTLSTTIVPSMASTSLFADGHAKPCALDCIIRICVLFLWERIKDGFQKAGTHADATVFTTINCKNMQAIKHFCDTLQGYCATPGREFCRIAQNIGQNLFCSCLVANYPEPVNIFANGKINTFLFHIRALHIPYIVKHGFLLNMALTGYQFLPDWSSALLSRMSFRRDNW